MTIAAWTSVEPITPNEPSIPAETAVGTRAIAARSVSARPRSTLLPWLAVVVAGTIAGMATVLALSWLPEATPVRTASASPATASPTVPAPAPVVMEPALAPTWTGQRQARWAHDGSRTITFELQATHDVPVWMSRARPLLVVQCLSRATRTYVALGTSVNFEADAHHRTIRLQWDDGPVVVQQWELSESGHELFAPDGVAFVRQLARGQRLRFGFTPFNAQPANAEFAVKGFDQLAGLVASTCGWRLDA